MKKKEVKSMVWFGKRETEYRINGVRYLVSSRYIPVEIYDLKDNTLSEKMKCHINSGVADLTALTETDMLNANSCLAAGKEEN